MQLRELASECKDGFTCPSVHLDVEDPAYVVVIGELVEPGAGCPVGSGEGAVRLRLQTIVQAGRTAR